MTIQKAIEVLEQHNRWRRGDEKIEMAEPKELGIAIEVVVKFVKKTLKNKTNE